MSARLRTFVHPLDQSGEELVATVYADVPDEKPRQSLGLVEPLSLAQRLDPPDQPSGRRRSQLVQAASRSTSRWKRGGRAAR